MDFINEKIDYFLLLLSHLYAKEKFMRLSEQCFLSSYALVGFQQLLDLLDLGALLLLLT